MFALGEDIMKYLVPLGAIGVLYVADSNGNGSDWSQLVVFTAALMVLLTLVMIFGGAKDGR